MNDVSEDYKQGLDLGIKALENALTDLRAKRYGIDHDDYKPGDVVVYSRVPGHPECGMEIGVVKEVREHGCFVAYHTGDTCAMTPYAYLRKADNGHAFGALAQRRVQLRGQDNEPLCEGYEDWSQCTTL